MTPCLEMSGNIDKGDFSAAVDPMQTRKDKQDFHVAGHLVNKQSLPTYGLIVGDGRSGSNWLLNILNASPVTFCRNEPQDIPQSSYAALNDFEILRHDWQKFGTLWDAFVASTASRMGERDLRIDSGKEYVHPFAVKTGLSQVLARPKLRRFVRAFVPVYRSGEWPLPRWMGSRQRLEAAYVLFKINGMRAWMVRRICEIRPDVPVLHIVRHPGGQLNSGMNRFFLKLNAATQAQERQLYQAVIKEVVADMPELDGIVPELQRLDLAQTVAWFWRINNEAIYRIGQTARRYKIVVYEELAAEPRQHIRDIYTFLELPFGPDVEKRALASVGKSASHDWTGSPAPVIGAWKRQLSPAHKALVADVLNECPLANYWPD